MRCPHRRFTPPHKAPDTAEAAKAGNAGGDAVFKLACRSCRRGYSSYYYPSYNYYAGYRSSYSPSVSYYYPAGCGGWSPCDCAPSYSYAPAPSYGDGGYSDSGYGGSGYGYGGSYGYGRYGYGGGYNPGGLGGPGSGLGVRPGPGLGGLGPRR